MKKSLTATRGHFESSCYKTPEYKSWHRLFKREFTKFLLDNGCSCIEIGKPNHFDMSGFFTNVKSIWWFRIEDLRWSKDRMLVRTAQSYHDYTGGVNNFVPLNDDFCVKFLRLIS